MLLIDFLNVGDGDAVLLRELYNGEPDFTILVDAGRPHVELAEGSLRRNTITHLMKAGIKQIDLMILTHLHFDHIGGTLRIMQHIPVRHILTGYQPPDDARWIVSPESKPDGMEKTITGLYESLNMLTEIIRYAKSTGCNCAEITEGKHRLTGALGMDVALAGSGLLSHQKIVFDTLCAGKYTGREQVYRASKDRNCSCPVIRFNYAGVSVLLPGDSYAEYWEDKAQSCDVLKLPHHGDIKSMTPGLLKKLAPEYAVISCQCDPSPLKERPSGAVMEFLIKEVPHVLCTENHELPGYAAGTHECIRLCISDNGQITHSDKL